MLGAFLGCSSMMSSSMNKPCWIAVVLVNVVVLRLSKVSSVAFGVVKPTTVSLYL